MGLNCYHSSFEQENNIVYCVKTPVIIEDTIKKSRFIGILVPCQNETEALQQLQQIHQQYPDASHLVFAYRILTDKGIISRFHDAGEPSGTAGKPVFQHLEGKDLINLLCVIVRYYGGIKLGAGGLTRAYGNSAKKAIEAGTIDEYIKYAERSLELDYKDLQNFEYQLKKLDGVIIQQDFAENIRLTVRLPEHNLPNFNLLFN